MIKAIVDSVSVSNGEVTKFSVIDDARGTVGSFQLFESDESKYGQYKVGDEFSLELFPTGFVMPEYKHKEPTSVVEPIPEPVEEPTFIDKVKDFFTPASTTESPETVSITPEVVVPPVEPTPGLDAPTFTAPTTDSPAPTV